MKIRLDIVVDDKEYKDFEDLLLKHNDIFRTSYIGYWAYGLEFGESGVLFFDFTDKDEDPNTKNHDKAISAFKKGRKLPKNYYKINKSSVKKIFSNLMIESSCTESPDYDGHDLDRAIQKTYFGEIIYA